MSKPGKPRLRFFENAASQRHITEADRYLYRTDAPAFRLTIIGTGTIGQEHMRVASLLGRARIHGIYDSAAHSMAVAQEEFASYSNDKLQCFTDLESACQDPQADALMICTPNHSHSEVLKVAMRSGKPIFLEKPMATTLADAAAIVKAAADYSSVIQIGLQYRYKSLYSEALQEVISRRVIGNVKTIALSEYRPPFLDKVEQWNKFSKNSGGTLLEKCCHYFDLLNLFAESRPEKVFASGGQAVNFRDFEHRGEKADIDDHAFVTIEYENQIKASFGLNMFAPSFSEELIIVGDRGSLRGSESFDFHREQATQSNLNIELGESGASRKMSLSYPSLIEQSGHHGATFYEHQAFIDQLEGKQVDSATPIQGLWSIVVACAAQQSMATGAVVCIDQLLQENKLGSVLSSS